MKRMGWDAIQDKIAAITGETHDDLRSALAAILDGRTKIEVMGLLGVSKHGLYQKLRSLNMNHYIESMPIEKVEYECNAALWEASGKEKNPCLFCTGANKCKLSCSTFCRYRAEYIDGIGGVPTRSGASSVSLTRVCL